jgi:hypothetical protein
MQRRPHQPHKGRPAPARTPVPDAPPPPQLLAPFPAAAGSRDSRMDDHGAAGAGGRGAAPLLEELRLFRARAEAALARAHVHAAAVRLAARGAARRGPSRRAPPGRLSPSALLRAVLAAESPPSTAAPTAPAAAPAAVPMHTPGATAAIADAAAGTGRAGPGTMSGPWSLAGSSESGATEVLVLGELSPLSGAGADSPGSRDGAAGSGGASATGSAAGGGERAAAAAATTTDVSSPIPVRSVAAGATGSVARSRRLDSPGTAGPSVPVSPLAEGPVRAASGGNLSPGAGSGGAAASRLGSQVSGGGEGDGGGDDGEGGALTDEEMETEEEEEEGDDDVEEEEEEEEHLDHEVLAQAPKSLSIHPPPPPSLRPSVPPSLPPSLPLPLSLSLHIRTHLPPPLLPPQYLLLSSPQAPTPHLALHTNLHPSPSRPRPNTTFTPAALYTGGRPRQPPAPYSTT